MFVNVRMQGHEPTTIATLIGLAASHIGTAHPLLSKTLCLHLPSLMYSSQPHAELEVSALIQTSALVGLALLHSGKASRLMVEFFLSELSAKNSLVCGSGVNASTSSESRECVALAAGWGLGMLLLARGRSPSGALVGEHGHISDLRVEDRLQQCIDGGRRPQHSGIFAVGF
jgi:anaphase-promoting complex subunit 1